MLAGVCSTVRLQDTAIAGAGYLRVNEGAALLVDAHQELVWGAGLAVLLGGGGGAGGNNPNAASASSAAAAAADVATLSVHKACLENRGNITFVGGSYVFVAPVFSTGKAVFTVGYATVMLNHPGSSYPSTFGTRGC